MPVVGKFVPIWLSEPPLMAAINWPPATARPWTLLLFSWEMPVPSAATCQTPLLAVAVPLPLAQTAPQSLLARSEEHTSELQSQSNLVCRLLLEKKTNPFAELTPG